jgi:hypothetical protein
MTYQNKEAATLRMLLMHHLHTKAKVEESNPSC